MRRGPPGALRVLRRRTASLTSKTGKIIVANNDEELAVVEALLVRGTGNGVEGLRMVDAAFVAEREPQVHAIAALYSPESGIVDAEALVKALLRAGESAGAIFLPGTRLLGADATAEGIALRTERETILAGQVVNAAGLYADEVSAMMGGEAFRIYPCRGEYAELVPAKRSLVNSLVYPPPLPSGHGLGVHLLKTVDGSVWLGPTAKYQDRKDDYDSDRLPVEAFVEPARRLLKGISAADLRVAGSGIRAKLHPPDEPFADFLIRRDRQNPRVIHAAGIESPGLTSCLAVGRLVSEIATREPRSSDRAQELRRLGASQITGQRVLPRRHLDAGCHQLRVRQRAELRPLGPKRHVCHPDGAGRGAPVP